MKKKLIALSLGLFALIFAFSACNHSGGSTNVNGDTNGDTQGGVNTDCHEAGSPPAPITAKQTVKLITYDSFEIPDKLLKEFEAQENIKIEIQKGGNSGTLFSQLVITKDNPLADVAFGLNNIQISEALAQNLFSPYLAVEIDSVPESIRIVGGNNCATPINYGDVCINFWLDSYGAENPPPKNLDDLLKPEYKNHFVTQNPESSTPGLAFLLATIAKYGDSSDSAAGWKNYWRQLRENGVEITSDWSEAYFTEFQASGGDKPLVTSYAGSPVASVVFDGVETPPTGVIKDGCFRQVEFVGLIRDSGRSQEKTDAAKRVIDFLLSRKYQAEIPLTQFINPANGDVELPEAYKNHAVEIENPLSLAPDLIAEKVDQWTDEWTDIVLR